MLPYANVKAAEGQVHLMVTSGYGQQRSQCEVASFRNMDEPLGDGGFRDYKSLFRGLKALGVPYANYEVSVKCSGSASVVRDIQVDRPYSFHVLAASERVFRSHGGDAWLTVRLSGNHKAGEVWWIRLIAVYGSSNIVAEFLPPKRQATVWDPPPGRYVVFLHSSEGFACSRLVDVFDGTREWTVHPAGCRLDVDTRAAIIPVR